MVDMTTVNISRTAADAAAERAKQQGLTTEAYLTELVLRDIERKSGEHSILVYDDLDDGADFVLDRGEQESDESYRGRASHFGKLFP